MSLTSLPQPPNTPPSMKGKKFQKFTYQSPGYNPDTKKPQPVYGPSKYRQYEDKFESPKTSKAYRRSAIPESKVRHATDIDELINYGQQHGISDIRKPGLHGKVRKTGWSKSAYNPLMDIVLNQKKAIVPYNIYTEEQARAYAEPRGYQYQHDVDLDGDGINDVIVYNKAGEPIIVNGYGLAESLYPYKKDYHEGFRLVDTDGNGTRDTKGSFNQYLRGKWGYVQPNNPYEDATIYAEEPPKIREYGMAGYKRIAPPRTQLSPYQIFMKVQSGPLGEVLREMDISIITKVVKVIHLIGLMYSRFVLLEYAGNLNQTVKEVKETIKSKNGKLQFRDWYMQYTNGASIPKEAIREFLEGTIIDEVPLLEYLCFDFNSATYGQGLGGILQLLKTIEGMKTINYEAKLNGEEHRKLLKLRSDSIVELENATENIKRRVRMAKSEIEGEQIGDASQYAGDWE